MQRLPTVPVPIPSRVYYGWVIVATGLAINMATTPLNPVVFSFFIAPMSEEMGWSLGALSLAITFRMAVSGATAPLIGLIIDRFGPRWLGLFAGVVAAGSLIGLFYTQQIWLVYLLFAISGGVGLGGGPGGNLLTLVPVAKWFVQKRGRAMSIATTGMAVGTVLAIPATQWIIQNMGWREAWAILGVMVAFIIIPLSLLFLRGAPSDLGLQPDGMNVKQPSPSPGVGQGSEGVVETDWTAKEALRHPVLWLILFALAVGGFALAGTLLHRVAYWEETGMSPALVAFGTAMDPFTFMFSVVVFGVIGEKVRTRNLALFGGLVFTLSMIPMILSTGQTYTIFAHNIIWASGGGRLHHGEQPDLAQLLWSEVSGHHSRHSVSRAGGGNRLGASGLRVPAGCRGSAYHAMDVLGGLLCHVGHSAVHGKAAAAQGSRGGGGAGHTPRIGGVSWNWKER